MFVAAGLSVGLLAACSSGGDTATTATEASEADSSVAEVETAEVETAAGVDENCVVAMSFGGLDITVWVYMLEVMEPIMQEEGCEFLTHDPAWDLQKQITDWQAWGNRGDLDAVMSWPVQKDAVVPVTAERQASFLLPRLLTRVVAVAVVVA